MLTAVVVTYHAFSHSHLLSVTHEAMVLLEHVHHDFMVEYQHQSQSYGRPDLLYVQLLWMSSSILHQLIVVSGKDVELGNDIKESPSHTFCLGHIGVQLVFAAQIPGPGKVVCLQQKDGTNTMVCRTMSNILWHWRHAHCW